MRSASAVQLGVCAVHGVGHPLRLGQQQGHPGALGVLGSDRLAPGGGGLTQRVDLAQALPLGQQRGFLRLVGRELLDLVDLEGQQVEVAVARSHTPLSSSSSRVSSRTRA